MKGTQAEAFILFNRQLASMVHMDLPLPDSLRRAGAELLDPRLSGTVAEVAKEIERGSSYSEAIAKRGGALPEVYSAMVRAGEASGNLAETLRQAASYDEQMLSLHNQLRANMIYPAIVVACLVGLIVLFSMFVIPNISMIYLQSGGLTDIWAVLGLPIHTRLLIHFGSVMGQWLTWIVLGAVAAQGWKRREKALAWVEERQLRIPLWNDFIVVVLMARFFKTLGALLKHGVGTEEAFQLSRKTMGQRRFEDAIAKAGNAVARGAGIGDALGGTAVFPATAIWLLKAAEERGDLVECLLELGEHYQQAADRRGRVLARVIEAGVIIILGLIVGIIVVSFFGPLLSLAKGMSSV